MGCVLNQLEVCTLSSQVFRCLGLEVAISGQVRVIEPFLQAHIHAVQALTPRLGLC
jgi:hypothetical protein